MGNGASASSPIAELAEVADRIALTSSRDGEYEGKGNGNAVDADETLLKVKHVKKLVVKLQNIRKEIASQSKEMSESKILQKISGVEQDLEIEKREHGIVRMSCDRSKSIEEYKDGTTIRRVDGTIERKLPDGTVQQISKENAVTERNCAGDISVLAEHDTLLNQKLINGTQIQTNLEERTQICVYPNGKRVETDAKERTVVTLFPNGKQVTVFDDKTTLTISPDGGTRQVSPNGTVVVIDAGGIKTQTNADGSIVVVYPDGRKVRTATNGMKVETFPNGARRDIDISNPKFGTVESKETKESTHRHENANRSDSGDADCLPGLPALNSHRTGSPSSSPSTGLSRNMTTVSKKDFSKRLGYGSDTSYSMTSEESDDREEDDDDDDGSDEYDHTNRSSIKISRSMKGLMGALTNREKKRKTQQKNTQLQNLSSKQVIQLINFWGLNDFSKDFAVKGISGKDLGRLESCNDELLLCAPSSVRKDLWYHIQQAKKSGLSDETLKAISPNLTVRLQRVRLLYISSSTKRANIKAFLIVVSFLMQTFLMLFTTLFNDVFII